MKAGRLSKQDRLEELLHVVEEDPFMTDEELSDQFKVSIQTIGWIGWNLRFQNSGNGSGQLRLRIRIR